MEPIIICPKCGCQIEMGDSTTTKDQDRFLKLLLKMDRIYQDYPIKETLTKKEEQEQSAKEAFSKIPKEVLKHMVLDSPPVVQDSPPKSVQQRPETLEGFTTRMKTGMGQLYVTVTELDGRPFEVFATIGKSGKSTTAKTEAIGRLISLALRAGVDVQDIIEQVTGIGGEHAVFQEGGRVLSIPDAIGRALAKRYGTNGKQTVNNTFKEDLCPDCGSEIIYEEGCVTCHSCGYTLCG